MDEREILYLLMKHNDFVKADKEQKHIFAVWNEIYKKNESVFHHTDNRKESEARHDQGRV